MANKIIFGRKALGVPTPLLIKAILRWVQRVCMAGAALSTVSTHEYICFSLIGTGWFAAEIEPLFGEVQPGKEDITNVPVEDKNEADGIKIKTD